MPGSDEQYDLVRVKDASSNSKADTFFVAPKHVGRDGAGTERMVLAETDEPPTPEAGEQYLFLGTDGTLKAKFADGSVTAIGGEAGAPDDAEYVTLASDPDLSAESLHQNLTGTELHDPAFHASRHESGGVDEINVQALSGILGERQFPRTHASDHSEGGRDPIDVDSLVDADLKADLSSPDGTVLSSQIPDLAVTETFTVPDQAGRLALTDVQEGDVALQTDTDEGYIFTGGDPSLDANWSLLSNFDPPVDSVFGRVGDIAAQAGDYAASQISNFSSAVLSAIDGASITPTDVNTDSVNTDEASVKKSSIESITFSGNTSEILPFDHGLVILSKTSGGSETGAYILNNADNSVEKVAGSSTFVTSPPSSNQVGVYHDGSNYIAEDNDSSTFEVGVIYLGK
jgi:hypothetical protein